ncbi:MAG: glycoside hydrolase family 3 C-terminal domain-containing protein [Anaerolineae bacterium]|nr:glycoside hydrolase family 3 C-terminal domain-containing protein [Anaerolineae bacterium]
MKKLWIVIAVLLFATACKPEPTPAATESAPEATSTQPPTATEELAAVEELAPPGIDGEVYYAPFPLTIELDHDLSDWAGVPTVAMPREDEPGPATHVITFAAAADDTYLYFMADVIDDNIVSGEHGTDYWNEDSVEFYVNGTGDIGLSEYVPGVSQITVPALDMNLSPEEAMVGGMLGSDAEAIISAFPTETGYAVEMAVPLENAVWSIEPMHGSMIGFQVHLNGTSSGARDTKLIWSLADTADQSYLYPRVFGKLAFFEIGQTDIPEPTPTPTITPTPTPEPVEVGAVYLDPFAPVEDRVADLLARMTLDEKIGQMTLVEKDSIFITDLIDMGIGGLLSGGGGSPDENTPEAWAAMVDGFQEIAFQNRLGIPMIYGVDAVHGHNNVYGAVIFPHNIGLGAADDPELMTRIGEVTAEEMIATGIYWNYAPVLAVVQDPRWGRYYEGYSVDPNRVRRLGSAYLLGLQGDDLAAVDTVLATPKHYIGDGGTIWGTSTTGDYMIDQGVTEEDEWALRSILLPPYIEAIHNGARSIMISFSSWGDTKMHANDYLINEVLKDQLGFTGFVVSDWGGIDQIAPGDYYTSVVTSINAGVDMNMVPYDYILFIDTMHEAVENGDITEDRIDDAVSRILRVKFEMGLFENPYSDSDLLETVGSDEHRAVAREAVAKSMVLLQNENAALPLDKDAPYIVVTGNSDDIGRQSGGWTISWQGAAGDITPGTTILEAIEAAVGLDTEVVEDTYGNLAYVPDEELAETACVAVVGEDPYAEGVGDSDDLTLPSKDVAMLERMHENCGSVILILVAGRPLIITDQLDLVDAVVMAWLPGTEGQGVADVLFGDVPFTGTLPVEWPRSMEQVRSGDLSDSLYSLSYGLVTVPVE